MQKVRAFRRGAWKLGLIFILLPTLVLLGIGLNSAETHTITIEAIGSGAVTRNPSFESYPQGSVVTLSASAEPGWYWHGWSGDLIGDENPVNITVDGDMQITAEFRALPRYDLTINLQGEGSITLDPVVGREGHVSNSIVTATAVAAEGWAFWEWLGDASGSENPLSLTMDRDKEITAVFVQPPIITAPVQGISAPAGETVTFSVQASGASPLTYEWFFEGTSIGANGPALELTNIGSADAGEYSVRVSNAFGEAISSASLVVTESCEGTNVVDEASEAKLRAAIANGGEVVLCFSGTIALSSQIEVEQDVTLLGGDRAVVISGNDAVRLFYVHPGVTFRIRNVTLSNGRHEGATGESGANGEPGEGGAIYNNAGTLDLADCTVQDNHAKGGLAGAGASIDGGSARGGAIYNREGTVLLQGVRIENNTATGGANSESYPYGFAGPAFGGAIYTTGGSVSLGHCELINNGSLGVQMGGDALGGAIYIDAGSLGVEDCAFVENRAHGADFTTLMGPFSDPGGGGSAHGGAIAAKAGTIILRRSRFEENLALGGDNIRSTSGRAEGGAIHALEWVNLEIETCTFEMNRARGGGGGWYDGTAFGGALFNRGKAIVTATAFFGNDAEAGSTGYRAGPTGEKGGGGGAIYNVSELWLTNSTLALNAAKGGESTVEGPFSSWGVGGGVYNAGGKLTLQNVTLASNSVHSSHLAYDQIAVGVNIATTNGVVTLHNSVVAYGGTNGNVHGTIIDGGHNISSDGSASFNSGTSFNFTDPRLSPLADNGGPTLTMALRPDSPAIDFGSAIGAPTVDQRGFARPFGDGFDIGAFEFRSGDARPALSLQTEPGGLMLRFDATAETTYHIEFSSDLVTWEEVETIGPSGSATEVEREFEPMGDEGFFRIVSP